jgi:hypothetical protein
MALGAPLASRQEGHAKNPRRKPNERFASSFLVMNGENLSINAFYPFKLILDRFTKAQNL